MTSTPSVIAEILAISGGALGVYGTVIMARRYLNVTFPLRALASAFVEGDAAKKAAEATSWSSDRALGVLRGLAIICLGFAFSLMSSLMKLFIE
jgi:hypothetical protein